MSVAGMLKSKDDTVHSRNGETSPQISGPRELSGKVLLLVMVSLAPASCEFGDIPSSGQRTTVWKSSPVVSCAEQRRNPPKRRSKVPHRIAVIDTESTGVSAGSVANLQIGPSSSSPVSSLRLVTLQ